MQWKEWIRMERGTFTLSLNLRQRGNKILIVGNILFFSVACIIFLCSYKYDNCKIQMFDSSKDTVVFPIVDTFPNFEYLGLHRTIQPAKQIINGELRLCRDSLLSVYLEDNVYSNYCEGVFQYIIQLDISETGKINKVTFGEDNMCKLEILQNLITEALKQIHFKPAIKDNKNVSVKITVKVLIDLYNPTSDIKKSLFGKGSVPR